MLSGCFGDGAPVFRSCERIGGLRFACVNRLVTPLATRSAVAAPVSSEQGVDECGWLEGSQIVDALLG